MPEDGESQMALSYSAILAVLPDSVANLLRSVDEAGGPVRWFRTRAVQYVLGIVGGVVFNVVERVLWVWEIVREAFVASFVGVAPAFTAATTPLVNYAGQLNIFLLEVSGFAGPLAPILVAGIYTAVIVVLVRLFIAAYPALTDALGAVPVVGSALDAALTFLGGAAEGAWAVATGGDG